MGDQLSDGRRIRVLNVVDDSTRKCLASLVAASLSSAKEVKDPDQLIPERAAPKGDCVEQLHPAGEAENALIESSNWRSRNECLNAH
ncbi:MAG: hypothetical protein M1157_04235 [Deinococcus sp.]|nr:hypothetical protein [Deinococcus sp.]